MTLRASLSEDISDPYFWVGILPNGDDMPITTLHSSGGSSDIKKIYVFNDGKRDSDGDETIDYMYKQVRFKPRGKRTRVIPLGTFVDVSSSTIPVEDSRYYNAGTKIKTDPINGLQEEMWIRTVSGGNLIVDRGKNGSVAMNIPNGTWVEGTTEHIYLSLTGLDGTWVNGNELVLPDIIEEWKPISLFMKVSTGALKTQVKLDTFFQILGNEYPRYY